MGHLLGECFSASPVERFFPRTEMLPLPLGYLPSLRFCRRLSVPLVLCHAPCRPLLRITAHRRLSPWGCWGRAPCGQGRLSPPPAPPAAGAGLREGSSARRAALQRCGAGPRPAGGPARRCDRPDRPVPPRPPAARGRGRGRAQGAALRGWSRPGWARLAPCPPLGAARGGEAASGVNKAGAGAGGRRSHGASSGPRDGGAARLCLCAGSRRRLLLRRLSPGARPGPARLLPASSPLRSAPRRSAPRPAASPLTNDVFCARRDER